MKRLFLIYWNFTLFGIMGCSDFLEPKSSDEYVPENAVALDEMLVEEVYTGLVSNTHLFHFLNILDDDVTISDAPLGFHEYEQLKAEGWFALYTLQPDMFQKMDVANIGEISWDEYYEKILGCNAALDYLDEVKDSKEMKCYVAAQALALRAFNYFTLVNLFGVPYNYDADAPGVPLKLSSNLTLTFLKRNSVREVYHQICDDLAKSDSLFCLLPADKQFSENFRINLPGVRFLRSRVNLYMENWEEVIRWGEAVLDWKNFRLYDLTTFSPTTSSPKVYYGDYTSGEVIWGYGAAYDLHRLSKELAHDKEDNYYYLFNASPELLASYSEEDHLRLNFYIFDEYGNYSWTGRKLAIGKVPCNSRQSMLNTKCFVMSLRLSELYLNLAEAYAMQGDSEQSLYYLNELRRKRIEKYEDVKGLSGEALIRFVREERRRELCFEGHRWFDLRRWGMETFTRKWKLYDEPYKNYVIEKNDPAFTLPIPNEVIARNPELEQNALAPVRNESL